MANRLSFGLESTKLPADLFLLILEQDFKDVVVTPQNALTPFVILPRFMVEGETTEYVIEKILAKKRVNGQFKYKVHWKGYLISEATWEPRSNLKDCEALAVFEGLPHSVEESNENMANIVPRTASHLEILDYLTKSPEPTILIPLPQSHSCDLYLKLGPHSYLGIAAKNTPSSPFPAGDFVLLIVATHPSQTLLKGGHKILLPKGVTVDEQKVLAHRYKTGYQGFEMASFPKGIPFPVVILTTDGIKYFLGGENYSILQ
eukprot:gene12620-14812_t